MYKTPLALPTEYMPYTPPRQRPTLEMQGQMPPGSNYLQDFATQMAQQVQAERPSQTYYEGAPQGTYLHPDGVNTVTVGPTGQAMSTLIGNPNFDYQSGQMKPVEQQMSWDSLGGLFGPDNVGSGMMMTPERFDAMQQGPNPWQETRPGVYVPPQLPGSGYGPPIVEPPPRSQTLSPGIGLDGKPVKY